jgi:hypothetical protein
MPSVSYTGCASAPSMLCATVILTPAFSIDMRLPQVVQTRRGGSKEQQEIDFETWAQQWNEDVNNLEAAVNAGTLELDADKVPIMRKKAAHLRQYWAALQVSDNIRTTMTSHRQSAAELRHMLRGIDCSVIEGSTTAGGASTVRVTGGSVAFPAAVTELDVPRAALCTNPVDTLVRAAASAASHDAALVAPSQHAGLQVEHGVIRLRGDGKVLFNPAPPLGQEPPAKKPKRKETVPKRCSQCGHYRAIGHYAASHGKNVNGKHELRPCLVPATAWVVPDHPTWTTKRFEGPCPCPHCVEASAGNTSATV